MGKNYRAEFSVSHHQSPSTGSGGCNQGGACVSHARNESYHATQGKGDPLSG